MLDIQQFKDDYNVPACRVFVGNVKVAVVFKSRLDGRYTVTLGLSNVYRPGFKTAEAAVEYVQEQLSLDK